MDDAPIDPPPARPPLGPGDDDPRSPIRGVAAPALPPLAPGASSGDNADDAYVFLAPLPPGPGDAQTGPRHVVRFTKKEIE